MLEHVRGRIGLITIEDIDICVYLVYSITTKLILPSSDTLVRVTKFKLDSQFNMSM
jgi:hypothetical protein